MDFLLPWEQLRPLGTLCPAWNKNKPYHTSIVIILDVFLYIFKYIYIYVYQILCNNIYIYINIYSYIFNISFSNFITYRSNFIKICPMNTMYHDVHPCRYQGGTDVPTLTDCTSCAFEIKTSSGQDLRIRGCPDMPWSRWAPTKFMNGVVFHQPPGVAYIYIYIYNPNITPNLGWTNIPIGSLPIDFPPKIPLGRLVRTQLTFAQCRQRAKEDIFRALQKPGVNNGTCGRIALEAWQFPNSGLIWWGWLWILGSKTSTCGDGSSNGRQAFWFFSARKIPKKIKNLRAPMKASPVLCGREV